MEVERVWADFVAQMNISWVEKVIFHSRSLPSKGVFRPHVFLLDEFEDVDHLHKHIGQQNGFGLFLAGKTISPPNNLLRAGLGLGLQVSLKRFYFSCKKNKDLTSFLLSDLVGPGRTASDLEGKPFQKFFFRPTAPKKKTFHLNLDFDLLFSSFLKEVPCHFTLGFFLLVGELYVR